MENTERVLIEFIKDFGNFKQTNEEKLGKIFSEMMEIKVTSEKTHEQACKTNGKVLRLENEIVPELRGLINEKADSIEYKAHKEALGEEIKSIKKKTNVIVWLLEKPVRFIAIVVAPTIVSKFIPDINWDQFTIWLGRII